KDSQTLLKEDIERWRGESPAAGQVDQARRQNQDQAPDPCEGPVDEGAVIRPANKETAGVSEHRGCGQG
ncbi:MAG: hypothetical protein ACKV2V_31465, partial [Blastocatellia bacterium]